MQVYCRNAPVHRRKAPDFALADVRGNHVRLSEVHCEGRGLRLSVLRGYPGYQCPYCTRQVQTLFARRRLRQGGSQSRCLFIPALPAI